MPDSARLVNTARVIVIPEKWKLGVLVFCPAALVKHDRNIDEECDNCGKSKCKQKELKIKLLAANVAHQY
jgi:hypothetical protein